MIASSQLGECINLKVILSDPFGPLYKRRQVTNHEESPCESRCAFLNSHPQSLSLTFTLRLGSLQTKLQRSTSFRLGPSAFYLVFDLAFGISAHSSALDNRRQSPNLSSSIPGFTLSRNWGASKLRPQLAQLFCWACPNCALYAIQKCASETPLNSRDTWQFVETTLCAKN